MRADATVHRSARGESAPNVPGRLVNRARSCRGSNTKTASDKLKTMSNVASGPLSRVLVADDEDNQRTGLAKMIQSWGFAVETAADGQEALEKLNLTPVNVLVTDLMMPRMDGFEL